MDPNQALAAIREAVKLAKHFQDEDTNHPLFCVVPNATVTRLIENFEALDEYMSLTAIGPDEWQ